MRENAKAQPFEHPNFLIVLDLMTSYTPLQTLGFKAFEILGSFQNYDRPHQSLNYSTPADVENSKAKTLHKAYSSNNSNSFYLNFKDSNIVQEVKM